MCPAARYDKIVLNENGFVVELSNHGRKLMPNPNPLNIDKVEVQCLHCGRRTKNMSALCTNHNKPKFRKLILHTADWLGRVIPPGYEQKDVEHDVMPHHKIAEMLVGWMTQTNNQGLTDKFVSDTLNSVVGNVPDATTLQANIDGGIPETISPEGLAKVVMEIVNRNFPKEDYQNVVLDGGSFKEKSFANIPIRAVATLLVLAWACEESNRGDAWFCKKHDRESKKGNAYMPSVYYFLRRYTNATDKQARICLK